MIFCDLWIFERLSGHPIKLPYFQPRQVAQLASQCFSVQLLCTVQQVLLDLRNAENQTVRTWTTFLHRIVALRGFFGILWFLKNRVFRAPCFGSIYKAYVDTFLPLNRRCQFSQHVRKHGSKSAMNHDIRYHKNSKWHLQGGECTNCAQLVAGFLIL